MSNRHVRLAGAVVFAVLMLVYGMTAAPDLTFWDASELATAASTMGIPHPPGTPLWVILGRLVSNSVSAFLPSIAPVRAVTLLSVFASALTGGIAALMVTRWIGFVGGVCAGVVAGTFFSVWNNATETEVYAVAILVAVVLLFLGERAGRSEIQEEERARVRGVIAFVAGMAVPIHLSVLVALPTAVVFAWRGRQPRVAEVFGWVMLAALGFSAVAILPLLASHGPYLNSGNPVTLDALAAVLRREQYDVAGLWPRRAPLWLQIGNFFQWADWQAGLALEPRSIPSAPRSTVTIVFVIFGAIGLGRLWRQERRLGYAMLTLVVTASLGVVVWLNMLLGPSFGGSLISAGARHEARERDYFFALAFWGWGVLAGIGIGSLSKRVMERWGLGAGGWAKVAGQLVLLATLVPLVLNWSLVNRNSEPAASLPRIYSRMLLGAVPEGGVLFTAGDNDTFPLWYLQYVDGFRTDVQVVSIPLMGAQWYREQLVYDGILPKPLAARWPGLSGILRAAMSGAEAEHRAIRVSALLGAEERELLDPDIGWVFEGLVFRPGQQLLSGETLVDTHALERNARIVRESVLQPLSPAADPALHKAQDLIRCSVLPELTQALLVSQCNGF